MNTEITELVPANSARELAVVRLSESARGYERHAKAPRTLKAYQSDWRHFQDFCRGGGFQALPATPETVALYLAWMADEGHKPATMSRRLAALSKAHSAVGFDSPAAMR